jgi:hypothetical protein
MQLRQAETVGQGDTCYAGGVAVPRTFWLRGQAPARNEDLPAGPRLCGTPARSRVGPASCAELENTDVPEGETSLLESADGDEHREAAVVCLELLRRQLLVRHPCQEGDGRKHIAIATNVNRVAPEEVPE